jgi:hypothetical protein
LNPSPNPRNKCGAGFSRGRGNGARLFQETGIVIPLKKGIQHRSIPYFYGILRQAQDDRKRCLFVVPTKVEIWLRMSFIELFVDGLEVVVVGLSLRLYSFFGIG